MTSAAAAEPAPRRTRRGQIIIGPSVASRWLPLALAGMPLVALVLSPLASAGLEQWRFARLLAHGPDAITDLLDPPLLSLLIAAVAVWILLALWALVPILATYRAVVLDPERRVIAPRTARDVLGLRTSAARARAERPLGEIRRALADPERQGTGLVELDRPDAAGESEEPETWSIPHLGWDDAGFDGMRALQCAIGQPVAAPRRVLLAQARVLDRARSDREVAERLGMPWREEYARDHAAFRRDLDHARRVLGGKEPRGPEDRAGGR